MTFLPALREHVRLRAEDRPGIYRMLDAEGGAIYVGKSVRVRTHAPIAGARSFSGRLAAASPEAIELEDEAHGRVVLSLREIERANYQHDFSDDFHSKRS